jgi:trans-aconitate methyltransferase
MKQNDDFNWEEYTNKHYIPQIEEMQKEGIAFVIKKSKLKKGKIEWKDNLHPHAKIIYSEVVKLKPVSVFECGCAGGHNLLNIKLLMPKIQVAGYDISISQIEKASKKLGVPEFITDNLYTFDVSAQLPQHGVFEYVFTNAVLMHMEHEKIVRTLINMNELSTKYIRLVENLDSGDCRKFFKLADLAQYKIKKDKIGYLITK